MELAEGIGYPVVLKLDSKTITHKTDVGGVRLNLQDADEVRRAYEEMERSISESYAPEDFAGATVQPMASLDGYELILGSSVDPQFGPVLLFGSGGQLVEVYKDRALALPPLTTTLARRAMERTRISEALKGVRGRAPVDTVALEKLFVRFSQLVVEQPWISEMDINPLLASPERLLALDARVVLHDPETAEEDLPRTAIRPYPSQYVFHEEMSDGEPFVVRPIRPEDEPPDGEVPRLALRPERLHALLPHDGPGPAHRPRPPHAHLLYRLRPRDGPGRRAHGPRRPGRRRSWASPA